jgi:hypothetical protein
MDDTITGGDISTAYAAADGASPAPNPSETTTPAASASADTTVPPAGQIAPDGSQVQTGTPPEHRWDAILANARNEWKAQYGWAEQVNRADLDDVIRIAQLSKSDPIGYVQQVIADLQADPQYAAQLRSIAAKALSQGRGPQPQQPPGQYPVVQLEDGQQLDVNQLAAQLKEELRKEYAPALTAAQKLQHAEDVHQADQFAGTLIGELSQLEGFEAKKTEIGQEVRRQIAQYPSNDPRTDTPEFLEAAALRAYYKVVLPTLSATARKAALTEVGQKTHANTVNPAQPRTAAPTELKDLSWGDALKAAYAQAK